MKYKELNLGKLRDENGLDFANFTYKPGMCSCCYGPKDLPKSYWKNKIIPEHDDYTYLLFKNADNGSGHVRREDEIEDYTCISWDFPIEKLDKICRDLKAQLGSEYAVLKPKDTFYCIMIHTKGSDYLTNENHIKHYTEVI